MSSPNICSFESIVPMIYAYSHPDYIPHQGWTKIGYTEKQSVEDRVKQQHHTSDIAYKILWQDNAIYKDGSGIPFTDHDFHHYLRVIAHVERKPKTEWFHVSGKESKVYFDEFASRRPIDDETGFSYTLREEQENAVSETINWFSSGGRQFLWNAKPRFGKTISSYDLVIRMGFRRTLIVTNRPSIANSWAEDFNKFVGWKNELCFVSDTDSLRGKPGVLTKEEYFKNHVDKGLIAFVSLQDLKGSMFFGGTYPKLGWIAKKYIDEYGSTRQGLSFDLLIVDEAQEGVETYKTEKAFDNIDRAHTLYLSGTPFKQLAGDQFSDKEIFNWSYADEQEKKSKWAGEDYNPYENLPQLLMFTYQLGPMIYDTLSRGIVLEDEEDTVDPAFDLNEFFLTDEKGNFLHQDGVKKFLQMLFSGEKYPFSTPELRNELSHTMWYLNRVNSAKALYKLMRTDDDLKPLFKEYEIILAAGDGRLSDEAESLKAYDKVKVAIATHNKTITLTVGQLTVGVTIPEWSGVFMLCNMRSPSSYMQAAFRAQNPCSYRSADGKIWRKARAYLFDFDPARTLIIYDQFANNLIRETASGGTSEDRETNIKRLLNFFPVLGEDDEGEMVELDATQVLTIPYKLKSIEVVRHGFMSNFLFANIEGIFGASGCLREIIEKLTPAYEEGGKNDKNRLDAMGTVNVDADGNAIPDEEIIIGRTQDIFGDKIYETVPVEIAVDFSNMSDQSAIEEMDQQIKSLSDKIKEKISNTVITPIADNYSMSHGARKRLEEQTGHEIETAISRAKEDFDQRQRIAKTVLNTKRQNAETEHDVKKAEDEFAIDIQEAMKALNDSLAETVAKIIQEKPKELVERIETKRIEDEKKSVEDEIRAHLRGFARTIPSFIMAYGDDNLTLANFDDYTEDDVFLAVTGISEEDFRFLRDGGDRINHETGLTEHFNGHLFDEAVFNDSIKEFLRKRRDLADYFDESKTEDIFDYIPPQKTNQIFTPRRIVKMMVDKLEEENPGCFDDPTKTFADLYMKSGLYITEIVKRLFKSKGLKSAFPNEKDRILHILQEQVYGMAPTRIIYLIATNYILGFDEELKTGLHNFVQADAAAAAKNGSLKELVRKHFDIETHTNH